GALAQAVEEGGDLGAAHGARPVVVHATQHDAAQRSLGAVVVEVDGGVLEKDAEALPDAAHVLEIALAAPPRTDRAHAPAVSARLPLAAPSFRPRSCGRCSRIRRRRSRRAGARCYRTYCESVRKAPGTLAGTPV